MFNRRFASILPRTFANVADQRRKGLELKYGNKLFLKMKEEGVSSIAELRAKVKKAQNSGHGVEQATSNAVKPTLFESSVKSETSSCTTPIKPLNELMDVDKIMATPHTPEQVAAVWNAYHATKGDGTGRGYLSASVPASTFLSLVRTAKQFPKFIIPLERTSSDDQSTGHEFYYLEWTFHRTNYDNDQAIVMFTPLQEYKLRQEFAQPYLVMTLYPELIKTHQIGLLRGEISSSPIRSGEFLLSQNDAQLLGVGLQKFYLAKEGQAGRKLLESFHQNKAEFQWEDLLRV